MVAIDMQDLKRDWLLANLVTSSIVDTWDSEDDKVHNVFSFVKGQASESSTSNTGN
jgi:hypothetical protein